MPRWYQDRIPFFEASDANITEVYYYRWNVFRAHQRDLGAQGYITTELYVAECGLFRVLPSSFVPNPPFFSKALHTLPALVRRKC